MTNLTPTPEMEASAAEPNLKENAGVCSTGHRVDGDVIERPSENGTSNADKKNDADVLSCELTTRPKESETSNVDRKDDSSAQSQRDNGTSEADKNGDACALVADSKVAATIDSASVSGEQCSADAPVMFKKGDEVDVFFRFEHSPSAVADVDEPLFAVSSPLAALQCPRIGLTDGWLPAVVQQDFPPAKIARGSTGLPLRSNSLVHVRLAHGLWGNRTGELRFSGDLGTRTMFRAKPRDVRSRGTAPKPKLSFICLRWGVWSPYHDKDGAYGGWGPMGTCICDKYIIGFFDTVYERLGPHYEVISCFIKSSADLRRLSAASLAAQVTAPRFAGGRVAAMYFLWPVAWLDGHEGELSQNDLAGYVEDDALFKTMSSLEAAGIPTRHPHPSHLYRLLTSKVWCAHMCLSPDFHVPATTRVNRALALSDPLAAASCALDALLALVDEQTCLRKQDDSSNNGTPLSVQDFHGVAKLGFAWEAREVYIFRGARELADKLRALLHQAGSTAEAVLIQQYVPHDCEIRVYCLHGKPEKLLYTRFGRTSDDGSPSGFRALERPDAVKQWFKGDDKGLTVAENGILETLVPRWIRWLRTESCETPSVIRMDFFVKAQADDEVKVSIGELTEQGASTLGWEDGAKRVFDAIIDSCMRKVPSGTRPLSAEADGMELKSTTAPASTKRRKLQPSL